MAKNLDDIIKALPATRRRKIERRTEELLAEEMTLQQLRQAKKRTQVELAKALGIAQKQISKIEERTDMHISTLRRQVEAMGGTLELVARFPDRAPVMLTGLETVEPIKGRRGARSLEAGRTGKPRMRA